MWSSVKSACNGLADQAQEILARGRGATFAFHRTSRPNFAPKRSFSHGVKQFSTQALRAQVSKLAGMFQRKGLVSLGLIAATGVASVYTAATLLPMTTHLDDNKSETVGVDAAKLRLKKMENSLFQAGETPIYRFVLTGGPCGGKSTAMAHISDRLAALGFRVYRVPEAATLLITAIGLFPPQMEHFERVSFEGSMIKTKIALEDALVSLAKASGKPSVVICDRGTMDTAAYMDQASWDVMMDEYGWNTVDLRDKRYDGVIHMVTAAIGAEPYYTTENNAARHEGIEEARALDFRVLSAWIGHPHIRIIDNSTDFQNKIRRVTDVICHMVGAPKPVESLRKFVISELTPDLVKSLPVKFETFEVEQTYLRKSDATERGYTYLRRRGQNGIYTYTLSTVRSPSAANESDIVIMERSVSGREYIALLRQADPDRISVKKRIHCFLWNNVYYEIQSFLEPDIGLTILNTEVDSSRETPIPWFVKMTGEVTGAEEFSSFFISKHFHAKLKSDWQRFDAMRNRVTKSTDPATAAAINAANKI